MEIKRLLVCTRCNLATNPTRPCTKSSTPHLCPAVLTAPSVPSPPPPPHHPPAHQVFATASPLLPTSLRGRVHGMASSVCFAIPFVRQLWWWLGLRWALCRWTGGLRGTLRSNIPVVIVVIGMLGQQSTLNAGVALQALFRHMHSLGLHCHEHATGNVLRMASSAVGQQTASCACFGSLLLLLWSMTWLLRLPFSLPQACQQAAHGPPT